ncbi:MAG TPA: Flp family type IVb pilin [Allosphingosinicella sp.]|jgi:pilus assembly protein Flp/PilA
MMNLLWALRRDEEAATAIEYGLIAALIAVGIIATVTVIGGELVTTFGTVGTTLTDANT